MSRFSCSVLRFVLCGHVDVGSCLDGVFVCRDTRWIGSWFQRQNNPNRKGSLAHQAMCDAKAAHAQGHGPLPKQPAQRSASMPSHPGAQNFAHHTFPSLPITESDFGLHMGTAEYQDRLRQAEMERQRREALMQADSERMPRTLIGPGIHPSMFVERRSSSSSLGHGGTGSGPFADDTHPPHSGHIIPRDFAPSSSHARYPGVDAPNSPPSPTDSQSANSPNPDVFSASQGTMSSGFAMPFSDSPGFPAGHAPGSFNVGDHHHHAHGHGHVYPDSFVNFSAEAYHHQYHHPFHHPQFHGNLGSAFQLGRPTLSRSASHGHEGALGMHLQYPDGSEPDGHGHGFDGLSVFSNVLLNPSSFIADPRIALDSSAHSSDAAHGLLGHDCGPATQPELSLPQDIAAPRPSPYVATYLHATSLQEQPSQSNAQARGPAEQHGLAGLHEHDPLSSNAAVQWDGDVHGFVQEHGQQGEHHPFYARAGESPQEMRMDGEEAAVDLQARFEALAAEAAAAAVAASVGMGAPLSMAGFYDHGELQSVLVVDGIYTYEGCGGGR